MNSVEPGAVLLDRPAPEEAARGAGRASGVVAAMALAVVLGFILVANLPAFVCMPPDADTTLYDLFARCVMEGSAPYRDLLDNNFPGIVWVHMGIRSVFGWRSEVIRAVDAGIVAAVIGLLVCWLPPGARPAWRFLTAIALASFYLITSEWCHCQRDPWSLLPALLALNLRRRQLTALTDPHSAGAAIVGRGVVEGFLWATACWIKPFDAIPCVVCWLAGTRYVATTGPGRWRRILLDGACVLTGGLLAGAAGYAWLTARGGWADFLDTMLNWNREYIHFDMGRDIGWVYNAGPLLRFAPWPLVHLAAVPVALAVLWRGESPYRFLLAALYLGWFGQVLVLQHRFDYVQVPPLMLGIVVLCQQAAGAAPGLRRTLTMALVLFGVCASLPPVTIKRLAVWPDCFRDGSSVALRDRLSMLPRMSWSELDQVRAFLATRGLGDGELTCLSTRTIPLYMDLGLRPPTRYLLSEWNLQAFASRRERLLADFAASRQRLVVCDVTTTRWRVPAGTPGDTASHPARFNPDATGYPRRGILFRAGRYIVYDVPAADMPAWVRDNLDP
jgi:hypothetical protein